MNFIVIISDTLRRDYLGFYGNNWISTPHIDGFARGAQVFQGAYSASFPTVPHRRDVMTGRFTAAYTGWGPLTESEIVVAQILSEAGYATAMITDCPHILENGYHFDRGFEAWEWIRGQESDRWKTSPRQPSHPCDPRKIRNADHIARCHRRAVAHRRYESDTFVAQTITRACEWLEDNYRNHPFFLYVDTFDPHEPWDAPPWYVERYDPGYAGETVDYPLYARTDFLSPSELAHCRALYAAEVTLVDRWIGQLLEKIADLGLMEDTTVILTTDHGFLLGEHGIIGKALISENSMSYIPLYEEINHIPLVVHLPGTRPGTRHAFVQPHDIMPTILDLAGIPIPDGVNGRSFAHVLAGAGDKHRDLVVSAPYLAAATAVATVRKGNWTAILRPRLRARPADQLDKAVDGLAKLERVEPGQDEMLFDLARDPAQTENLAERNPGILEELRRDLLDYLASVGTSDQIMRLWRGDLPPR